MPRDYKPDKQEHYDDRRERDHRMDTGPYPPDRRSMKRSREYDQREPKEPYGRDEREHYDRRDRERRMYYQSYYYYSMRSHVVTKPSWFSSGKIALFWNLT